MENKTPESSSSEESVIHAGELSCLMGLLSLNHMESIKKEACCTISNITAGNKEQIQAVIEAGLIGPLVNLLQTAEFEIKKEAALTISNISSGSTPEQIKFLVSQGCIEPLCDLLLCPDQRTITACLEVLDNILKAGDDEKRLGNSEDINYYTQLVEEADGYDRIERLQKHDNDISNKAMKMLAWYWFEDEEEVQDAIRAQWL